MERIVNILKLNTTTVHEYFGTIKDIINNKSEMLNKGTVKKTLLLNDLPKQRFLKDFSDK